MSNKIDDHDTPWDDGLQPMGGSERSPRPSETQRLENEIRRGHGVLQRIRAGLDELITELPRFVLNTGHYDALTRRLDAIGSRIASLEEASKKGGGQGSGVDAASIAEIKTRLADLAAATTGVQPPEATRIASGVSRRWMFAALALGGLLAVQLYTSGGVPKSDDGGAWAWVGRIWSDNDSRLRECIRRAMTTQATVICDVAVRP